MKTAITAAAAMVATAITFWLVGYYGLPQVNWDKAGLAIAALALGLALVVSLIFVDSTLGKVLIGFALLVAGMWVLPQLGNSGEHTGALALWLCVLAVIPLGAGIVYYVHNREA